VSEVELLIRTSGARHSSAGCRTRGGRSRSSGPPAARSANRPRSGFSSS